jgi:hypothetical protein
MQLKYETVSDFIYAALQTSAAKAVQMIAPRYKKTALHVGSSHMQRGKS